MSRWIREHLGGLGFGGTRRPPPPEPPQPDYSAEPELSCGVVLVMPDLERAYRAQRDRDFADPYTTTDQSDGLGESGSARPGERETLEAVRPSPPPPPPSLTSASPKHRLIRVAGKVASPEEREDPAEGPAPPTPPCLHIESDSGCRKGPILPSPTAGMAFISLSLRSYHLSQAACGGLPGLPMHEVALRPHKAAPPCVLISDVEAKEEEGSVRPLPLHHLYDTPYEPPFARGLPQPESPSGNERVKAPPGDPARLAETAPPDPDCDPPASSSPTQALALLPSHPSTPRAPPAPSSIPSEPPSQPPARDSRMPKDDDRPPEEYDQPWEWKRDCISQAFAADVSCTDELPWPPPVGQLDGEAGPSIVPGENSTSLAPPVQVRSHPAMGETAFARAWHIVTQMQSPWGRPRRSHRRTVGTDVADRAMGQQLWFHGDIGRVEAEQILQQHRTSSFLVRPSESDPRELSLSLRSAAGFVHMCVSWDQGGHVVLGGHSPPFASVPEAVLFYRRRRLPVRGAEQLSLRHPVPPSSSLSAMSLTQPAPRRPLSDDGLSLS
ncbi:SH2 domain-containing adapter protein D-like [Lampetra planeri]